MIVYFLLIIFFFIFNIPIGLAEEAPQTGVIAAMTTAEAAARAAAEAAVSASSAATSATAAVAAALTASASAAEAATAASAFTSAVAAAAAASSAKASTSASTAVIAAAIASFTAASSATASAAATAAALAAGPGELDPYWIAQAKVFAELAAVEAAAVSAAAENVSLVGSGIVGPSNVGTVIEALQAELSIINIGSRVAANCSLYMLLGAMATPVLTPLMVSGAPAMSVLMYYGMQVGLTAGFGLSIFDICMYDGTKFPSYMTHAIPFCGFVYLASVYVLNYGLVSDIITLKTCGAFNTLFSKMYMLAAEPDILNIIMKTVIISTVGVFAGFNTASIISLTPGYTGMPADSSVLAWGIIWSYLFSVWSHYYQAPIDLVLLICAPGYISILGSFLLFSTVMPGLAIIINLFRAEVDKIVLHTLLNVNQFSPGSDAAPASGFDLLLHHYKTCSYLIQLILKTLLGH